MGRSYKDKDMKLLFGRAAGRCSNPECRRKVTLNPTASDAAAVLGEIAHILPHSPENGPRASVDTDVSNVDGYGNLILLCPNCHTTIDKQSASYPTKLMQEWKSNHEKWVDEQLTDNIINVTFTELDLVTKSLLASGGEVKEDLRLIPPSEKIRKNELSTQVAAKITAGMIKSTEVREFLGEMSKLDENFSDRLVCGFTTKYKELRESGVRGDNLFNELHVFASNGSTDFNQQSAGLAVLTYLFETCEVFEK